MPGFPTSLGMLSTTSSIEKPGFQILLNFAAKNAGQRIISLQFTLVFKTCFVKTKTKALASKSKALTLYDEIQN